MSAFGPQPQWHNGRKKNSICPDFFLIIFKEQQVLLYVTKNAEYLGLLRISSTVLFKAS